MTRKLILLLCLLLAMVPVAAAQDGQPVVFGVFFYSPTCPHCHDVIDNHLPGMYEEFGDQFQLLFVNVQTAVGETLFRAAYNSPTLPLVSLGVPTMVIGNEVMVGSFEIPQRAPILIRNGLEQGGIGLPDIFGLSEAYAAGQIPVQSGSVEQVSGLNGADNLWAWSVVAILLFSLVAVALRYFRQWPATRSAKAPAGTLPRWAAVIIAVAGVLGAGTVVVESGSEPVVTVLAVAVILLLFAVVLANFGRDNARDSRTPIAKWALPAAVLAGLVVASYLAFVEVAQAEAVCGIVGDCNAVQQSEYATLFGVLPVGVLGIVGYVVILSLWGVTQAASEPLRAKAKTALLACALGGVGFSLYLTFLELFVIHAVCMWCLMSALIMALVLWLVTIEAAPATTDTSGRRRQPAR